MKRAAPALLLVLLLAPGLATAELVLPSGFSAEIYVSGSGFGSSPSPAFEGIPTASTMAFDDAGRSIWLGTAAGTAAATPMTGGPSTDFPGARAPDA